MENWKITIKFFPPTMSAWLPEQFVFISHFIKMWLTGKTFTSRCAMMKMFSVSYYWN